MPSDKNTESPHNPALKVNASLALGQLLALSARMLGRFWGARSGWSPKNRHRVYSIWVDPRHESESQQTSNRNTAQPTLHDPIRADPESQSKADDHRQHDPLARAAALWAIARLKSPDFEPPTDLEGADQLEDELEPRDTEQIVRLRNELWSLLYLLEGEDPRNDS